MPFIPRNMFDERLIDAFELGRTLGAKSALCDPSAGKQNSTITYVSTDEEPNVVLPSGDGQYIVVVRTDKDGRTMAFSRRFELPSEGNLSDFETLITRFVKSV